MIAKRDIIKRFVFLFLLSGCARIKHRRSISSEDILNGSVVTEDNVDQFRGIVRIADRPIDLKKYSNPENMRDLFDASHASVCTGVLVKINFVLTAAHCVVNEKGNFNSRNFYISRGATHYLKNGATYNPNTEDNFKRKNLGDLFVSTNFLKESTSSVLLPEGILEKIKKGEDLVFRNEVDLALIKLSVDLPKIWVKKIRKTKIPRKLTFQLVGYGFTQDITKTGEKSNNVAILHQGENKGRRLKKTSFFYVWNNNHASVQPGDSGSPALDENDEIVGISSFVYNRTKRKPKTKWSFFVDLQSEKAQKFLESYL